MSNEDLKQHINSNVDFYELLDVTPVSSESEVRRAYRKTALKYHPDKVGPANTEALDKFHLLQIAYDVLSDPAVKELYDNARRAREEKKEREQAYAGRRKTMKEELEAREQGFLKRKREEDSEEVRFQRELARLAEDGKRRRKEREELLRREANDLEREEMERVENGVPVTTPAAAQNVQVQDADRSVSLRFPANERTRHLDRDTLLERFGHFGEVEDAILREKRLKPPGGKHKVPYITGVLVFKSIVGAHAAVSDFDKARREDDRLTEIEDVNWASGAEPAFIPKPQTRTTTPPLPTSRLAFTATPANGNSRKAPSFGSFQGLKAKDTNGVGGSPSMDETTIMRLKNAEKRRIEEKIRKEEAAAEEQGT